MASNEKSNSGNSAKAKNLRKPGTFGCIPLWIMHLKGIAGAFRILLALYVFDIDNDLIVSPGLDRLAKFTGIAKPNVSAGLANLIALGMIEKLDGGWRSRKVSYRLIDPSTLDAAKLALLFADGKFPPIQNLLDDKKGTGSVDLLKGERLSTSNNLSSEKGYYLDQERLSPGEEKVITQTEKGYHSKDEIGSGLGLAGQRESIERSIRERLEKEWRHPDQDAANPSIDPLIETGEKRGEIQSIENPLPSQGETQTAGGNSISAGDKSISEGKNLTAAEVTRAETQEEIQPVEARIEEGANLSLQEEETVIYPDGDGPKDPAKGNKPGFTNKAWNFYSQSCQRLYSFTPRRTSERNGILAKLIREYGETHICRCLAFFLTLDGLYKRKAYDLKLFCKDFDEIQQARARGDRSVTGYPVSFYEMKKEQYDREWGKLEQCFTGQEQRAPDPDDIEAMLAMRKAELDAAARENGGAVFNEDGTLAQEPPQNRLYETMHGQPAWDPDAVSNSLCEQFRVKFRRDLTQAELDFIMPAAEMAGADTASEIISYAISQSMGKDAEKFINALFNDLYKGARRAEGIRA